MSGSNGTTRRSFLHGVAAVGVAQPAIGIFLGSTALAQDNASVFGEATMPAWSFIVHTYASPYRGQLIQPKEPVAGTRYIGADVEVRNDSDRPLSVSYSQFRLRTVDGIDYPVGSGTLGADPRLFDVNMAPGERTRGWVYFAVPEHVELTSLVYAVSAPQLLVSLSASTTSAATPEAGQCSLHH